ncbi:CARDB domain-containing protein [Thermococcus sp. JdF3]|uniref:CARDB domain-containing protein n=1 Tax=Thermococcus sp. JdF3 TaxID=1638258 RepID=UPI001F1178D5|nr:CARDB domain-containing protein [Thermococcus sp. JdF3]
MGGRQRAIVLGLILLLLGSGIPTVMGVSYAYSEASNVQLFLWPSGRLVAPNQTVTIAVVLWKPGEGGVANATVTIEVEDRLYNVTTNGDGFASLNLTFTEEGGYEVRALYGEVSTGTWIDVKAVPEYLFIEKDLELQVNRAYTVEWNLVTPYLFTPYSGTVNVTVLFNDRAVESRPINVTGGKLRLSLQFNETGTGSILFDGRTASYFEVRSRVILAKLMAPDRAYVGQNVTVHILALDAGRNTPYSGNVTVKTISFNGTEETVDRFTIEIENGYGNFTVTVPECDHLTVSVELGRGPSHTIWVERPAQAPTNGGNGNETPLIFTITPDRVLAEPGQSISFVVNTTREGTYNMTVTWYGWRFTSWDVWDGETNTTLVTFNGTKSVLKRIKVPEWAYYGEIRIGNAVARVYTLRPSVWADAWVNLTYSPEIGLETGDVIMVSGDLKNKTKDWFFEWEEFYRGLVNETVHIFTPWGVKAVKTGEDGRFSASIPVPSERLPDMVWDRHPEVLVIHRSGAYADRTVDTPRGRVFVNITSDGVRINVEPDSDWRYYPNLTTPTVVEFGQSFDWYYIGNVTSVYVNSTNATIPGNISAGVYMFKILPNHWLCLKEPHGTSCGAGSHSTERVYYVTGGLELPDSATYSGGELEVPIKLPGRGVFYYSYDSNGQRHYGVGFTDENGSGVARIEVGNLPLGGPEWLIIKFGFVSDRGSLFDINWNLIVRNEADVLPPAITADVTPEVQEVGKNVTVYIDVRDDGKLRQVNFTITNVTDIIRAESFNVSTSGFVHRFNFTVRGLEDYILNVTAVDEAGHVSTRLVNFYGKAVETRELNLTANETHELNVANQTRIVVAPAQNESVAMNITVASAVENESARVKMTAKGYEDLKYVKVETNGTVEYSWVILNLTYSDEMLRRLGISENAVTLLYWNGSEWIDLSKHVGETIPDNSPYGNITVFGFGRDPVHNYAWANVSHLSEYSLGVMLPDLRVVGISAENAVAGKETEVSVTLVNNGGAVDGEFTVSLYANDTLVKTERVSGIGAGEEKTVKFTWTPDKSGTYILRATADGDDAIVESNETNNELSAEVRVTPAPKVSKGTAVTRMNYIGYMYYHMLSKRFEELYNESLRKGVDNETLTAALEHRKLAEEYYEKAEEFGPVLQNLNNPQILAPLRRAYLEMLKAVRILEEALG